MRNPAPSLIATIGSGPGPDFPAEEHTNQHRLVDAVGSALDSIKSRIESDTIEIPVLSPLTSRANALRQQSEQSERSEQSEPLEPTRVIAVVKADPAVAGCAMRLASSPFVGGSSGPIRTVEAAVARLGIPRVLHLLDTVAETAAVTPEGTHGLLRKIWTNMIYTAQAAELLARWVRHPEPNAVYVAALFHNIGEPLLIQTLAESERAVDLLAPQTLSSLVRYHHGLIGHALLSAWGFQDEVANLAANHHTPIQNELPALVAAGNEAALRYGYRYLDVAHSPGRLGAALDYLGLHRSRIDAVDLHITGSLNEALTLKG